jgi:hypothetical protein
MLQLTEFTEEKTIDINGKVYRDVDFGRIWGGVSYRRSFDGAQFLVDGSFGEQRLQLITPIIGANIKNQNANASAIRTPRVFITGTFRAKLRRLEVNQILIFYTL